jgi:hypothetical protein
LNLYYLLPPDLEPDELLEDVLLCLYEFPADLDELPLRPDCPADCLETEVPEELRLCILL